MKKKPNPKAYVWKFDALNAMIIVVVVIAFLVMIALGGFVLQCVAGFCTSAKGEGIEYYDMAAELDILQDDSEAELITMLVTGNHVRMRAEPNTDCKVTGHKDRGEKVEVVEIKDGWAKLVSGDYISADYLVMADDPDGLKTNAKNAPDDVQHYAQKFSDIVVVSLTEQYAWYYRSHELVAYGPVTTGRNGHKTPTSEYDQPFMVTQKRHDFDMGGDANHHVKYAIFFNGNIGFHDADWQTRQFGSEKTRKSHGSAGCVRCNSEDDFIGLLWQYTKVDQTRVAVLP